jgi:ketosteroid isomerase-like protein
MNQEMSMQEIVSRFHELAQQEKWFEIQDELFSDDVKSIDPPESPYMGFAQGKSNVRQKGENWVARVTALHGASTSAPVVGGKYFAVGRKLDITTQDHGRIQLDEVMIYEVKDGKIVSEQFFY